MKLTLQNNFLRLFVECLTKVDEFEDATSLRIVALGKRTVNLGM